ncbi:GNAT family N-acetyltransferase [Taibaiella koreensis]|uniref:GNAT family N-acetyltransferase n=1 Tax=Taibaiella koreensis TaxID=1268548 RepID=UPI000E5A076B|nr:GNAT family N-acetyltransferase [Taibaiella koreensis]
MEYHLETERLGLRSLNGNDAAHILKLDTAADVLRYLPGTSINSLEEAAAVIAYIQQQYTANGIGRWAMIRKADGAFLGWCGIKWVNDKETNGRTGYHDIGYRLLPAFWQQGYAFEAAKACCDYGFATMGLQELHATVMEGNVASARIIEKLGMQLVSRFEENGNLWRWYTLKDVNR